MKPTVARLLGATALTTMSAAAFADGIDPTVLTEGQVVGQIIQLATLSGTIGTSAQAFLPEWSEELGLSATGALGYTLSDRSAIGLLTTAGQRQREVLLNFGLAIDAERQIFFSGGQLQEKLEFGTDGAQEQVKQNEFGVAYDARNYSLSIYHVNSDSTDSFVGVKSTGAEIEGKAVLSSLASLNYGAGYQALDWDDGIDDNNGLTARLGLDYQAPPDVMLNVFADHNVSENQYGIGARSNLGAGTLSSNYTRIDGNVGSISDDNRVSVTFAMPLRGATRGASGVTRSTSGAVAADTLTLLADVMRRPDYLPERVIVKASGAGGSVCDIDIDALTAATPLACEFGAVADQRNSTVLVSGNTVSWNDSQTVPLGDYAIYLITTDYDNTEVLSLGTSSIAGTSFSVSTAGQQFLNNYWDAERMTEVIFLQDDGNCGFEDQFSLSTNFDFIRPS